MANDKHPLRFGIKHVLYAVAVIGSSLALFGIGGLFVAAFALWVWRSVYWTDPAGGKSSGKTSMSLVEFLVVVAIIGILVALLLPAVRSAREAARIMSCQNNLKQIALALHNYHDTYKSFPPAYIADESGKPMHSWRVLIAPFLESSPWYDQYRFDEPWNGPNNRKLAKNWLGHVYRCPSRAKSERVHTSYFAVTGPNTAWAGEEMKSLDDFSGATSSAILVVELPSRQTHWMAPVDVSVDEATRRLTERALNPDWMHANDDGFFVTTFYGRNAAMADGSVVRLPPGISRETATALFNVGDGRAIEAIQIESESGPVRQIKWRNIFRLAVFVAVLLLPAFWLGKRRGA